MLKEDNLQVFHELKSKNFDILQLARDLTFYILTGRGGNGKGLLNELTLRTVDCSALRDFDSMVLTVLIAWQKKLLLKGESIAIVNAPEKLKVLAGLYGVSQLLGLV